MRHVICCVFIIVFIQRTAFERIDCLLTKHGFRWAPIPASETDTHSQLHEQRDNAGRLTDIGTSHCFLRFYYKVFKRTSPFHLF
jgi:hypothetical protein